MKDKMHNAEKCDCHRRAYAEIRDQFPQHKSPARQGTYEELLEGSAFALPHDRHGCCKRRSDLQDDADDPGNVEVWAPHCWVVEHLRPDLDGDRLSARFA